MSAKRRIPLFGMMLLLLFAAACSSGENQTIDPSQVSASLATEPASVASGQETTLIATLEGIPDREGEEVVFEIRKGRAAFVDAKEEGLGVYSASYTFPEPGQYDVYIHYYHGRDHIAKLIRLSVT